MVQVGDVLADRYELTGRLGRGGMAEVYRGHDRTLQREIAIKVLAPERTEDEDFIWRFEREARSAAALNHRNVVGVHDTGEDDGTRFIVMELVDGPTLDDVIRDRGALPVERVIAISQGICDALEAAHANGLIHRDIKSANIMFDDEGVVKVADFGLARAAAATTQTATVYGSAPYMSPEQARGDDLDARSDLYSLGCVMYAMLTGAPPFEADSALAVVYQHLNTPPTPPSEVVSGVPQGLEAVVLKALEKRPDDRYASVSELREDLDRVAAGHAPALGAATDRTRRMGETAATTVIAGAPVATAEAGEAPSESERRKGPMVGSAVLLGVALLVLLVAFLFLRDTDEMPVVDETPIETPEPAPVEEPDPEPEPEPDPEPEPEDPDPEEEPPPDTPPDDELPPDEAPLPDDEEEEETEEEGEEEEEDEEAGDELLDPGAGGGVRRV